MQERWRGQGARNEVEIYAVVVLKIIWHWQCESKGEGGAVLKGGRSNNGKIVITAVVVFEWDVLRLISGYAPQSGRGLEEKQSLRDELKGEWDMHSAGDLVMCMGTLMDRLIGILMDLMLSMEGMV